MITMAGFDRSFEVPRNLRAAVTASGNVNRSAVARKLAAGRVTAWDLVDPGVQLCSPAIQAWASRVVDSVLTAAAGPGRAALDCLDCDETGYFGIPDREDPDILRTLLRREGDSLQELTASGEWRDWSGSVDIEIITAEIAEDLASAVMAGASGLARRYFEPIAFLTPGSLIAAADAKDSTAPGTIEAPGGAGTADGWTSYAIVDELDTGAILNLIRIKPGPTMEKYESAGQWVEDSAILTQLRGVKPPPLVELDAGQLKDVVAQIDSGQVKGEDAAPADKETPAPDAADTAAATTEAPQTAAGALVADAPLTVSPDPRAEKLRRYWSTGKGGLKIRWGTPGSFSRCVKQVRKHMPGREKGYCANLTKRNEGKWPGAKHRPGHVASAMMGMSTEEALLASLRAGTWTGHSERALTMTGFKDGIYEENVGTDHRLIRALTAGGFPVEPPAEWFDNPQLASLTPLTVDDNGRVFGHLASFDMPHIGMPGKVRAPRSRSDYQYFKTGAVRAVSASGEKVTLPVGNLTRVGGHAPLSASAKDAVKHYDDTESAVADVNVGEDRFGIWFAGSLRPEVTPAQLRGFMASALSGDWRPIGGSLELVAACSVNVPGFPIARTLVAGGAIMAMTAAGARPIARKQFARASDEIINERLNALEAMLADAGIATLPAPTEVETVLDESAEPVAEDEESLEADDTAAIGTAEVPDPTVISIPAKPEATDGETTTTSEDGAAVPEDPKLAAARQAVIERRRAARRARVHASASTEGASDDGDPKATAPVAEQTQN